MKKIVTAGVLAICALVVSQQQVSAWTNTRFSMGMNWEKQSGNNSCLWGGKRDGQVPAPIGAAPVPYVPTFDHSHIPYPAVPDYGSIPHAYYPMPQSTYETPSYAGTPTNYSSPYQFANYPRSNFYYYYPNTWSYYGR